MVKLLLTAGLDRSLQEAVDPMERLRAAEAALEPLVTALVHLVRTQRDPTFLTV